jgi:energy-coupling factor transporter ATP-binding protein EcfA2
MWLNTDITALIGPNGSGKTNLLKAITLLQGRTLPNRPPSREISLIKCQVEAEFRVREKPILFKATIFMRQNEQNEDEILFEDNKWNFGSITGQKAWLSSYREFPWADREVLSNYSKVLPPTIAAKALRRDRKKIPKASQRVARTAYRAIIGRP